jgi:hypothetical protein|tara:strand:- start:18020 stop:18235 length:216 start_codon:yes stop_codon:yes gene_type:complete
VELWSGEIQNEFKAQAVFVLKMKLDQNRSSRFLLEVRGITDPVHQSAAAHPDSSQSARWLSCFAALALSAC